MKEGWEKKSLMEISSVSTGKRDANHASENGAYRFYTCAYDYLLCDTKRFEGECLILPGNGVNVGEVFYYNGEFDAYQRTYVISDIKISSKFLHYHMQLHWKSLGTKKQYGSATNFIKIGNFKEYEVEFPPLPEQQRIVFILDKAFAAIDKAKANAEQNLQNAKELFDCVLDNILYDKRWEVRQLGEVCEKVEYGTSSKAQSQGKLPVMRMGNIQNGRFDWESLVFSDNETDNEKYLLKYNDVLFNRTNSPELVGKTAIYKGERPAIFAGYLIRVHRKEDLLDADYLNYFLNSKMAFEYGQSVVTSSVNQANINGTKLKSYPIPLPSLKEQQTIVRKLDALRAETQKLEAVYQKKIDDLEELKKSILQKAFAGELTSSVTISVPDTKVIPLQKVEGISPTDLQAGITALALKKHIEKDQQHSFHHVKAEKIVHLSEYILNIDLNRNPVKDAAGPNDFPHAKKVESRARKAGFYSVHKKGDYYDYKQGNSFNKVIQKAQDSLGEKADALSQIIDILAPMSTQQAEIVATVYAAWNNLLLTQEEFSDEDIVTEARENWHKSKLAIERDKFFNAIEWVKKNQILIPKGNGKIVEAKTEKSRRDEKIIEKMITK